MHLARRGNRLTAAIVVLTACAACAAHPVAAPGRLDPSSAPASSASAASPSTTPASSIATPSAAAASMTPTHIDSAGFLNWQIVPCTATNTCMWATQDELNALALYSADTGDVVGPVASVSSANTELEPVGSDYDPQWRYFVQESGQAGAAPPAVNALMRVPAAGGEPQVVVPNLVQPSPFQAADNYVV